MTRPCRQRCSGGPFDHEPTVMSIARSTSTMLKLRCPICRREVTKPGEEGGFEGVSPGVDTGKTPL